MPFSPQHYRRVSPVADMPQDIVERRKRYAALNQAHVDTISKFAPLTESNISAALAYQEERYAALLRGAK